jgi:hypothetical protein
MATAAADLFGVVAYPSQRDLDRALEPGKKATGVGSTLITGRVVNLTNSTGIWAQGTSGNTGRAGIIPKLYQGYLVNTDSSSNVVVLTGQGAEFYAEAYDTIKPDAKVIFGDNGTLKAWSSGMYVAVYKGHYGEASGSGEPATDLTAGQAGRFAWERGG